MECSRAPVNGSTLRTSLGSPQVYLGRWNGNPSPSSDGNIGKPTVSHSHLTFRAASLPSVPSYKQFSVPLQHRMLVNPRNPEKTEFYPSQTMTGDTLWAGLFHTFPTLSLLVHDYIRDSLKQVHASLLGSFSQFLLSESSVNHRLHLKRYPVTVMHSLFLLRGYHFPVAVDCIPEPGRTISACAAVEGSAPELATSSVDAERREQTLASQDGSFEFYPRLQRNNMRSCDCLEAEQSRKYQVKETESNSDYKGTDMGNSLPSGKFLDNTADVNFNFVDQSFIHGPINDILDSKDESGDSDEEDVELVSTSNVDPVKMKSVGEGNKNRGLVCEDEGPAEVTRDWWQQCEVIRGDEEEDVEWDDDSDDSDGETDFGGIAEELWKSFEESALSPHLCMLTATPRHTVPREHASSVEHYSLPTSQHLVPLEQAFVGGMGATSAASAVCVHKQLEMVNGISASDLSSSAADYADHDNSDTTATEPASDAYICPRTLSNICPVVCQTQKRVHFPQDSKLSTVHQMVVWDSAYRAARKGPWVQFARNRAHFRRRIEGLASVLEPCLAARRAAT